MDGETESAKQRMEKVDKALAEYEQTRGLPIFTPHNEGERYLNMRQAEIRKLTPDELGEAATVLAQFGFHVQRAFNEEMGRASWAEDQIRKTIATEINQYTASSYEERKQLAIQGNEYAKKMDAIRAWAKARADRIGYLSSKIEFLAKTFSDLYHGKRRQYVAQ